MNGEQLKKLILQPSYDFLRTNEHIKNSTIFLTVGGSHAYGTNIEGSDVDIRGVALNSCSDLLGISNFEQVVDNATDTVIYSFNKLISLLLNCNPNTIELLGCRPDHYFVLSDAGKAMIDNRKMFLSKRAVKSFGGYATQQLRRLENAIARDKMTQDKKEEHILKSMQGMIDSFESRYTVFEPGSIKLYTGVSSKEQFDTEVFCDVSLKHYPVRDFDSIINDLTNVIKAYEKMGHRNHKKDDDHLNKHAMHLVRLYLMCLDILEKGDIFTYRENEREFLLSIRNGKYQLEDGSYSKEFFDMITDYEKRLAYAKENTDLPDKPNLKQVEEFVMSVNRGAIND